MRIKFRYIFSLLHCVYLKLKYGNKIQINPFKVYISPFSTIQISGKATIVIKSDHDRVYISKNSKIYCAGGVLTIGNGVFFNENNQVVCYESIQIGNNCLFGPNVCIYDADHQYRDSSKPIRYQGFTKGEVIISEDVWIGAGTVITKGTKVGRHVVIGANSVVRGILGSNSVYAGNPLREIRKIHD